MGYKMYLVKLGEISLKGLNRGMFEKTLKFNIKNKLRPYHSEVKKEKGRLFFRIDDECPDEKCDFAFATTFGISGYSKCLCCEKNMDAIMDCARELVKHEPFGENRGSFKCDAARSDKKFPLNSYQICCTVADAVFDRYPDMHVDVKHPDIVLHCEIREDYAYLYTSPKKGLDGLPVSTAGKALLLLSGGIDSPVAAFRMAGRGLRVECCYYHAYPYTSELALEKVKTLAQKIAPYTNGTRLHVLQFTDPQLHIKSHSNEEEHTLMFRACMMKTATQVARRFGCQALVTGEALSQVASQTLESMAFTDSCTDMLILRPLVGMDKDDIIRTAKKIGTYETSILPYEDCCVIFSPKHPITHPIIKVEQEHYENMHIEELLDKAVAELVTYDYDANGNLTVEGQPQE